MTEVKLGNHPPGQEQVETRQGSYYRGLAWVMLSLVPVFGLYLAIPHFARKVPWRFEQKISEKLPMVEASRECKGNTGAQVALQKLVRRLYPILPEDSAFPISVSIIRGSEVNAFAFLGGKIFVYDGLVQQSGDPDELAGVLSHEMEHVRNRHVTQGMIYRVILYSLSQLVFPDSRGLPELFKTAAGLRFSRGQEALADAGALARLREARVSADGFRNFFKKRTGRGSWTALFSDHPSDQARLEALNRMEPYQCHQIMTASEWLLLKSACSIHTGIK